MILRAIFSTLVFFIVAAGFVTVTTDYPSTYYIWMMSLSLTAVYALFLAARS
jgi:hypothetical protein